MRIGKEKRTLGMHADGMLLLEADRILHSGGFFVWTVDVSLQLQSLKGLKNKQSRIDSKYVHSCCWSESSLCSELVFSASSMVVEDLVLFPFSV